MYRFIVECFLGRVLYSSCMDTVRGNIATFALREIAMFPVWWYSRGLLMVMHALRESVAGYAQGLGIRVWVRNIFVPMYGQYDWQSRIISVFMRSMQIAFRGTFVVVLGLIALGLAFLYVVLPFVAGGFFTFHLLGVAFGYA